MNYGYNQNLTPQVVHGAVFEPQFAYVETLLIAHFYCEKKINITINH